MIKSNLDIFPDRKFSIKVTGVENGNPEFRNNFVLVAEQALAFMTEYRLTHNSLADITKDFFGRGLNLQLNEIDPSTDVKIDTIVTASINELSVAIQMLGDENLAPLWAISYFQLLPRQMNTVASKLVDAYYRNQKKID